MQNAAERTRYVLIARLPRPLEVRLEDAFLGLGGTTKPTMGYHITLLGPFYLAEGISRDELDEIAAVCSCWRPFVVRIGGLNAFREPDSNAVYLEVSTVEELSALHRTLAKALRDKIVYQHPRAVAWNANYAPHVTLGLGLTDEELALALQNDTSQGLEATFEISQIHLMEQEPNQPWEQVASYALGAEAQEAAANGTANAPYG